MDPVTDNEKRDCLRLIRSAQVGPITYHRLIARFHTATAALDALPDLARRGGAKNPVAICSVPEAEKEIEKCISAKVQILSQADDNYPPRLKHIEDSPPILFVRGRSELLRKKAVAVIGARNASTNGLRFAERIAADLGRNGLLVVSGLARGIDAAAHRGAVGTGTVAVMGGGVDIIYPLENTAVYEDINERGVIISEMPVGTLPKASHFPRRNRIISGISRGIVVVEAAPRSGSLITARLALEQGRDVFAVPGSAVDPRARGTNDLIRQGAILTESAVDVLEVINPGPRLEPGAASFHPAPDIPASEISNDSESREIRQWLENRVGPAPVEVDDLAREFQAPASVLTEALMELELAGRVERHPGNMISAVIHI
ncbi:MAG: DNA-protecting protein DprA [Rhodospirillales bacterium]|nr:DNA-protecting protein DprA [Rhodospirillales bacterium]